jgi:hypothetical protein
MTNIPEIRKYAIIRAWLFEVEPTSQPNKMLTKGGGLREVQGDVPCAVKLNAYLELENSAL